MSRRTKSCFIFRTKQYSPQVKILDYTCT